MDVVLIIIGIVLLLLGIVGCIIPALPGPPIAYLSLVTLNFHSIESTQPSGSTLLWYGLAVLLITLLDYWLPIWGTKKFGGTKAGKNGSIIGLILAFIFPIFGPFTILIGPFIGAVVGELIGGQDQKTALKSGVGSFLGFLSGTILKLGMVGVLAYEFIKLLV
jgi:uncharacterized protein YqgC (DUF456 family)